MYKNAADILPRYLVDEIQKYVQGKEIYIPKQPHKRLGWGERNGTKQWLNMRNQEIKEKYRGGASVEALMESYHLSYESIRRIVRE